MQLSIRSSDLAPKLLIGSTWLLALALAAWIAATWYWHFSGTAIESAQPVTVSDPQTAAQDIASRQLFGIATAPAATGAASDSNLVVTGVSTRWGKLPGFAIIRNGATPADAFVEGDLIAPGIKLLRVLPDAVEVDRNGTHEQIKLSLASRSATGTLQNRANQPMPQNQPAGSSAPADN
ncbi:MAG: alpha,2-mannosidase [Rhodocyclales bacterium]|nr:alpha,2-mannosidase [Rhodocyclales bacterium]